MPTDILDFQLFSLQPRDLNSSVSPSNTCSVSGNEGCGKGPISCHPRSLSPEACAWAMQQQEASLLWQKSSTNLQQATAHGSHEPAVTLLCLN